MSDLAVSVGGLTLRGPVMAASGTFGYGTEVPLLDRSKLGGMVSKGIFLRPRRGAAPPRIVETPGGMLNAIGLQGPGVEALVRDYAPHWASWEFPVLVQEGFFREPVPPERGEDWKWCYLDEVAFVLQ